MLSPGDAQVTNPYDKILLEKRVETCRARYDALWDAKSHIDVQLKAAKLSLVSAMDELQNFKQLRMF